MIEVIYPFLKMVGALWTTNKIIPVHEHFVSNLIRQRIITEIDNLPSPKANAKSILLFLTEGEQHEIGLLMAHYIAKSLKWKVYYFGQNLPLDSLIETTKKIKPDALLTFFVVPRAEKTLKTIQSINQNTNSPLLVSGNPINFTTKMEGVDYLTHPDDLSNYLNSI